MGRDDYSLWDDQGLSVWKELDLVWMKKNNEKYGEKYISPSFMVVEKLQGLS